MRCIAVMSRVIPLMACSVVQAAPVGTAFTYQGQFKESDLPMNEFVDLFFYLFDEEVGGNRLDQSEFLRVELKNGLFQVELDFGSSHFGNDARWLEIAIRSPHDPTGAGPYETLSPRQRLAPTPFAMKTRGIHVSDLGDVGIGTTAPAHQLHVETTADCGVAASTRHETGQAVVGEAESLVGSNCGVLGKTNSKEGTAVHGHATATTGTNYAVRGTVDNADGYSGFFEGGKNYFEGRVGIGTDAPIAPLDVQATGALAIVGRSTDSGGILGESLAANGSARGVHGKTASSGGDGVFGEATAPTGSTHGVSGLSLSATGSGVFGSATDLNGMNFGVFGISNSSNGTGVAGFVGSNSGATYGGRFDSSSLTGTGVFGRAGSASGTNFGVHGHTESNSGYAGYFTGGRNYFEGRLGIGVEEPAYKLHVAAPASLSVSIFAETEGSFAGWFQSDGVDGAGLVGLARATGVTNGVFGRADSTAGRGVFGIASAVSGITTGVIGQADSTSGRGVFGQATAETGPNYGGRFESSGDEGRGVFGAALSETGFTYGVSGRANSTEGVGVLGIAPADTGDTYGGRFEAKSPDGIGVYGYNYGSSGATIGVFGKALSPAGYGGYFESADTGVWANTSGAIGVRGEAINANLRNWGGYFTAEGMTGRGVYGEGSSTTGANFGGKFKSRSSEGIGVQGEASANSGLSFGVYGLADSAGGYDFYAAGDGIDYGTASSRRWKSDIRPIDSPLDKLAQIRGVYYKWDKEHGGHHDVGMIAEEVGKVLPEIVNYEENGVDAHGMDYSKLTPLLVEALNALRAEKNSELESLRHESAKDIALRDRRIEALESANTDLAARLAKLERMVSGVTANQKPE